MSFQVNQICCRVSKDKRALNVWVAVGSRT